MLTTIWRGFLDLTWPCTCLCCDDPIEHPGFCDGCALHVYARGGPRCVQCDADLPTIGPIHHCGRCLARRPRFDRVHGLFDYAGPVGDAIRKAKYSGRVDGERAVARVTRGAIPQSLQDDLPHAIVPMPLHRRRLRRRSDDLPVQIAAAVAQALRVPLAARLTRRIRDTSPQAGLDEKARRSNVRGAFATRPPPADVLIVDDVLTTGATADALARCLKRAGALRVRVLAAAVVSRCT
ncbi:MAG: putative amidophosphoribosyltransferase [Bradymonadia bacterium]|jgi:predicted amidophosphoribosyltransferase